MSNNPFPLEDGDPGTPFYGAHADRDGSESKTKELHSYLAAVVDWPEDAVQVVARLRAEVGALWMVIDGGASAEGAMRAVKEVLAIIDRAERAESNARGKQAVIEAQRATLDRVRAALSNHPRVCDRHDGDDPVQCGWKRAVLDVERAILPPTPECDCGDPIQPGSHSTGDCGEPAILDPAPEADTTGGESGE